MIHRLSRGRVIHLVVPRELDAAEHTDAHNSKVGHQEDMAEANGGGQYTGTAHSLELRTRLDRR